MLEFVPAIGTLLSYGSMGAVAKKGIGVVGTHRAIVYSYIVLVALLFAGAALSGIQLSFPIGQELPFAAIVIVGAVGAIAQYKAMSVGKASVIVPVGRLSTVIVLIASITILGETLGILQVAGALMILLAALVIARDEGGRLSLEPWMPYLLLTIACHAFYYTFIKGFVTALGPYQASLFLETGIAAFVIMFHALRGHELSPEKCCRGIIYPVSAGVLLFLGSVSYSLSVSWIGAGLTSAIYSGTPIVNSVLAYAFLGERLDAAKYAAIALMVLGLLLILF